MNAIMLQNPHKPCRIQSGQRHMDIIPETFFFRAQGTRLIFRARDSLGRLYYFIVQDLKRHIFAVEFSTGEYWLLKLADLVFSVAADENETAKTLSFEEVRYSFWLEAHRRLSPENFVDANHEKQG